MVLAWSAYIFIQYRSLEEEPRPIQLTSQEPQLLRPEKVFVLPLEASPGPPVNTPEIPALTSSKHELWSYGERYLGWQNVINVDLERFDEAELRAWLEQDQALYGDRAGSVRDEQSLSAAETE